MNARKTTAQIFINQTDVTKDLSPFLREVRYVDNLSGAADTIELQLTDVEKLFIKDWAIERGSTLAVTLIKQNWNDEEETLKLGEFECDEIEFSTPPSVMRVKANSIPDSSYLRQQDESKSFEHVKLSKIAQDIADAAQMELFFEASDDPEIDRAEQGEQSNLSFLENLCRKNYLALKVSDNQIIIFDEKKLDEAEPVLTIRAGDAILKKISIKATLTEIYKSCEVNYQHSKHAEKYSAKIEDPTKETGKILKINRKVNSQAEAEKLAENELREKNKKENTLTLNCTGNFALVAGNVLELKDFGVFDGNFLIEKATHTIGSGYEVRVECRKCLNA
ncbi:MAG: hypothetical protein IJK81_11445 [Selenomonadaceae bacterium]|nr:hypothetical protein [Selenomonadaceae bacterium]